MIKRLINAFKGEKSTKHTEYTGLSDFFLRAPAETKRKVIKEAALKANDDQLKVFESARVKAEAN